MKSFITGLALLLLVSACALADDTINLSYVGPKIGFGSANISTVGGVNSGIFQVSGKVNGVGPTNTYDVVCITPNVWLDLGAGNPHTLDYNPFSFTISSTQQSLLSRLWGTYYGTAITSTANSSAFQLAAWEIFFETGTVGSLGGGNFTATSGSSGYGTANTWLSNLVGGGGTSAAIMAFVPDHLNPLNSQILITAVPEPGFYGVLALGLSGLYMFARRKKSA